MKRIILLFIAIASVFVSSSKPVINDKADNWVYNLKKPTLAVANFYYSSPFDGTMQVLLQITAVSYDRQLYIFTRTSGGSFGTVKHRAHLITIPANMGDNVTLLYGFTTANST